MPDYYRRYKNGTAPPEVLLPLYFSRDSGGRVHVAQLGVWADTIAMNERAVAQTGKPLCINYAYRTLAEQQRLYLRFGYPQAAYPGRSKHGEPTGALDIEMGTKLFRSDTYAWMVKNGPAFGFAQPGWAKANGSNPEAWHWEHASTTPTSARGKEIADLFLKGEWIMASVQDVLNELEPRLRQIVRDEAGISTWLTQLAPIGGKNAVDVIGEIHAAVYSGGVQTWLQPIARRDGIAAIDVLLNELEAIRAKLGA